ncbi:MAG TPA: hypothetical protein VJ552_08505 [Sediminibacterium sp.]|nr:hypothetical protein [Sediminibacterium sp.]
MRTVIFLAGCLLMPPMLQAQQISPVCAYCGRSQSQLASSGHASSCPYYVAPKKTSAVKPGYLSSSNSMQMMVAGTLVQGILSGIFSSNQQAEQQKKMLAEQQKIKEQMELAKQKKIKDSVDQVTYMKLMQFYKSLQGGQKLGFKKPDGDLENLARSAREMFDGAAVVKDSLNISGGTNFFGTRMDSTQIRTLIDPDNDSIIADITNADLFISRNKISDSAKAASLKPDSAQKAGLTAVKKTPDCDKLQTRLDNYLKQRDKFHKTIQTTRQDLEEWKQRNNDALWNAATTGFELMFSKFLGNISAKGAEAEGIKGRLLKHEAELRAKGVDVDGYLATLNARIFNANNLAKDAAGFKDAAEYDAFFRDALQAGVSEIAETDTSYNKLLKDTTVQQLLNDGDHPEIDAGQVLAGKTIEKILSSNFLKNLAKFNNKIPYVTYAQFTVDQAYNALDWYLSYRQIKQLRELSGEETRSAMSLQLNIDKTFNELKNCQ